MRYIGISIHVAIFLILSVPQPAGALDLGDYIPWLFEKAEKKQPQETMEAPFREEMDSQQKTNREKPGQNKQLIDLYEKNKTKNGNTRDSVDERHRSDQQIAQWVTEKVANALSLKPGNIDKQFQNLQPSFTKSAYTDYRRSLRNYKLLPHVRNRNFHMKALVEDDPFLIEEGSEKGIYKWRFETPVLISFTDSGATQAGNRQAASQNVTVRMQITRKPGRAKGEGVVVERWQIDKPDQ